MHSVHEYVWQPHMWSGGAQIAGWKVVAPIIGQNCPGSV